MEVEKRIKCDLSFGVHQQTYRKMVEAVKSVEADSNSPFDWAFDWSHAEVSRRSLTAEAI